MIMTMIMIMIMIIIIIMMMMVMMIKVCDFPYPIDDPQSTFNIVFLPSSRLKC